MLRNNRENSVGIASSLHVFNIYIASKYIQDRCEMYVHIVYFRNCYRKYRFSSLYVGRTTAVVHWRKELEASLAIFDQTPTYFLPIDRTPRCFPSSRNYSNIFLCSSSNFSLLHFIHSQCIFAQTFESNIHFHAWNVPRFDRIPKRS